MILILKVFPHWEDGASDLVDTPGLKIENNVLDLVAIPEGGAADWFGVNRGDSKNVRDSYLEWS